jgi:CBS domain-containing protein
MPAAAARDRGSVDAGTGKLLDRKQQIWLQPLETPFVIVVSRCARNSLETRNRDVAMKVKNSMHKGAHWVSPDTPVTKLAQMMREQDIGAIPVGENDKLIGMVTDRDIALRAVADGKDISRLTARSVMTKGIAWCRDTDDVSQALQIMGSKQIRRLPVIDKNKRMVGILSLGDLAHTASPRIAADAAKAVSGHHA